MRDSMAMACAHAGKHVALLDPSPERSIDLPTYRARLSKAPALSRSCCKMGSLCLIAAPAVWQTNSESLKTCMRRTLSLTHTPPRQARPTHQHFRLSQSSISQYAASAMRPHSSHAAHGPQAPSILLPQAGRSAAEPRLANDVMLLPVMFILALSAYLPCCVSAVHRPCSSASGAPGAHRTHTDGARSAAVLLLRLAQGVHLGQRRPARAQASGVQRKVAEHERHHACTASILPHRHAY